MASRSTRLNPALVRSARKGSPVSTGSGDGKVGTEGPLSPADTPTPRRGPSGTVDGLRRTRGRPRRRKAAADTRRLLGLDVSDSGSNGYGIREGVSARGVGQTAPAGALDGAERPAGAQSPRQ